MNKIALALTLTLVSVTYSAENQKPTNIFEIRQAFDQPTSDSVEMEVQTHAGDKETLHVAKTPVMTTQTVERAALHSR
jgi:hypothetical protein